jgi:ATP-dependent Clp protease adapter protein ClpS
MAGRKNDLENLITEIERIGRNLERCIVIYTDEYHVLDDVVAMIKTATGLTIEEAYDIAVEAHINGKAVCFTGGEDECERIAGELREAGLLVEVE